MEQTLDYEVTVGGPQHLYNLLLTLHRIGLSQYHPWKWLSTCDDILNTAIKYDIR